MSNKITDFEVQSSDKAGAADTSIRHNFRYLLVGVVFGIVFVKAEIISWFRIQEMFRLQSFHMYGVIGSAVVVGIISVWIIKKSGIKAIDGTPVTFQPKKNFTKDRFMVVFYLDWVGL